MAALGCLKLNLKELRKKKTWRLLIAFTVTALIICKYLSMSSAKVHSSMRKMCAFQLFCACSPLIHSIVSNDSDSLIWAFAVRICSKTYYLNLILNYIALSLYFNIR